MQEKEGKNSGIVITLGYTDGENLKNIPPKGKKEEELKTVFMTPELLTELEEKGEIIVQAKAIETSKKIDKLIADAKKKGITEIPPQVSERSTDEGR